MPLANPTTDGVRSILRENQIGTRQTRTQKPSVLQICWEYYLLITKYCDLDLVRKSFFPLSRKCHVIQELWYPEFVYGIFQRRPLCKRESRFRKRNEVLCTKEDCSGTFDSKLRVSVTEVFSFLHCLLLYWKSNVPQVVIKLPCWKYNGVFFLNCVLYFTNKIS